MNLLEKDVLILSEAITHGLLREQPLVTALAQAMDRCENKISEELYTALQKFFAPLRIGRSATEAFAEVVYFNQDELQAWVELIEKTYANPHQAKALWLDWLKDPQAQNTSEEKHIQFLKAYLNAGHSLWVVCENRSALDSVVAFLNASTKSSVSMVAIEENRESLALLCKRDKLKPEKGQILLMVEADIQGQAVLTGIDEISMRLPGRLDYQTAFLYQLKYGHRLVPTGIVPMIYQSLAQSSGISSELFRPT